MDGDIDCCHHCSHVAQHTHVINGGIGRPIHAWYIIVLVCSRCMKLLITQQKIAIRLIRSNIHPSIITYILTTPVSHIIRIVMKHVEQQPARYHNLPTSPTWLHLSHNSKQSACLVVATHYAVNKQRQLLTQHSAPVKLHSVRSVRAHCRRPQQHSGAQCRPQVKHTAHGVRQAHLIST